MKKQLFTFIAIALCTLSFHNTFGSKKDSLLSPLFTVRPKKNDFRLQLAKLELNLSQTANIVMATAGPLITTVGIARFLTDNTPENGVKWIGAVNLIIIALGSIPISTFFTYRTLTAEEIFPISFVEDEDKENTQTTENHN